MPKIKHYLTLIILLFTTRLSAQDIPGCTYEYACNYNPEATVHEDVCDFDSCAGCTYPSAANFDPLAILDNGSCDFYGMDGCIDHDVDGYTGTADLLLFLGFFDSMCDYYLSICDEPNTSTDNCTFVDACNFNSDAIIDDGSCLVQQCTGCTYPCADNYDSCATFDDGTCVFALVPMICSNDPFCELDYNLDGNVNTSDLLILLGAFGQFC